MYKLELTGQEIETIAKILQEAPYKIVQPILDNIAKQIEDQNNLPNKKK